MRVLFLNKKQYIIQNALLTNAHMEMDDCIGRNFYFQMIFCRHSLCSGAVWGKGVGIKRWMKQVLNNFSFIPGSKDFYLFVNPSQLYRLTNFIDISIHAYRTFVLVSCSTIIS